MNSISDKLCLAANNALQTLFGTPLRTEREDPADSSPHHKHRSVTSKHIAGLMRINHCGEVCAQALYQGQAITAKLPQVRQKMEQAAIEENDHLEWCANRLKALNSHTSYLNPVWYVSSFAIGAAAGLAGDKWSLGFVAETEYQVVKHLDEHLAALPIEEQQCKAVLEQMKIDELEHATAAIDAGGAALPPPIKIVMKLTAKLMTKTAYYI
jgi:3-demethoxyubiquinol 3-hydroxylase